ncbi:MAG: DUF3368 domain-containing protein [Candidatus Binatia bacterium]
MILVIDASALITLARINRLDLLPKLAKKVYIPPAVYDEVVGKGKDRPGSREVMRATWITRRRVRDQRAVARLRAQLGGGEAEAIVLARELSADFVILDDARARQIAEREGNKGLGLLGLLIRAKQRGIVEVLKPIIDEMMEAGFFIDDALYRSILRHSGEEER